MLSSIVHKNIGKKWEAILAQIFVVGGRFPPYPAMCLSTTGTVFVSIQCDLHPLQDLQTIFTSITI